jgi:hypothetical protein
MGWPGRAPARDGVSLAGRATQRSTSHVIHFHIHDRRVKPKQIGSSLKGAMISRLMASPAICLRYCLRGLGRPWASAS